MHWGVDLRSTWRGLGAMKRPGAEGINRPGWTIRWALDRGPQCWCIMWTPIWHEGRGPYVSIGLGPLRIYRGY